MNTDSNQKLHMVNNVSKITTKDRFLRLPEVESLTGFKKSTLYTWIKEGTFPQAIDFGRNSAWSERSVLEWIENKKIGHEISYAIKDEGVSKKNGTAESLANAKIRLNIASMALQGLLSNPNLKSEILRTGGAHSGWIKSSAVAFADALIGELNK
jgi:prophage regulatory protein